MQEPFDLAGLVQGVRDSQFEDVRAAHASTLLKFGVEFPTSEEEALQVRRWRLWREPRQRVV